MSIDTPVAGADASATFAIGGWAIDTGAPTGSGVDAIHVWAFPASGGGAIFVGVGAYGADRPDVGAAFGGRFAASGFNLLAQLAPGVYDVVVYAHSSLTGTFNNAASVRVTVR
jgi:hypothetical protein